MSAFEAFYAVVARIPKGCVATYGQVALLSGWPRQARTVGYALRVAPRERDLPCHRVVNRFGDLAPEHVFGGQLYQRMLLEEEGVAFRPDGRVDLCRSRWRPGPDCAG